MDSIITIISIILVSCGGVIAARRLKVSSVVILILIGLMFNIPVVNSLFIGDNAELVFALGDIGLITLMLLAGLETSWRTMYKERRDAVYIAGLAAVVSFSMGFLVFYSLGFSVLVSAVVGICMTVTAEATKAKVLMELGKLRTRLGAAIMGAGIVDNIIGLSIFMAITYALKHTFMKEDLLLGGAIMAFFIGVLLHRNLGREHRNVQALEKTLTYMVVPFFFVSAGLNFEFSPLTTNLWIVGLIIAVALSSKFIGTFLARPFTGLSYSKLHLIGWAMNSRGAVELALALIAFRSGLLPVEIYSGIIVMALVTTIVFPFVFTWIVKRNPGIMK